MPSEVAPTKVHCLAKAAAAIDAAEALVNQGPSRPPRSGDASPAQVWLDVADRWLALAALA